MKTQGTARRYFLALSLIVVAFTTIFLLGNVSSQAATLTIGWLTSPGSDTYNAVYLDSSTDGTYTTEKNTDPTGSPTVDEWSGLYSNQFMSLRYDITLDEDPVVTSFFSLQNNSGFTNTFTFTVNQPVSPIVNSSLGSGSTAYTLTAVSPVATLDTPLGSALYTAEINGSPVQQLFPGTSPATSPLPFSTSTSGTINTSFSGQPEGPASLISIFNNFTLTSSDLASATSIFKIDATNAPEPTSIALALLGLLGIPVTMRLRRR